MTENVGAPESGLMARIVIDREAINNFSYNQPSITSSH